MPVRIYEIAKKVGIPSKEVLAKAKELGITNAKVASSTLDKITAEYLEEQIAGKAETEIPSKKEVIQPSSEPLIITAPAEESDLQESQPLDEDTEEESESITENKESTSKTVDKIQSETDESDEEIESEQQEEDFKEKEQSDLGKKVGFIELGAMPTRSKMRERKKKKDKNKDPERKNNEAKKSDTQEERSSSNSPRKPKYTAPADGTLIAIKPPIIVRDLAEAMNRKPFQLIADLMSLNVFANVNQSIDEPAAREVCAKNGFRFRLERRERGAGLAKADIKKKVVLDAKDEDEDLQLRAPVVTIMGHVYHR